MDERHILVRQLQVLRQKHGQTDLSQEELKEIFGFWREVKAFESEISDSEGPDVSPEEAASSKI